MLTFIKELYKYRRIFEKFQRTYKDESNIKIEVESADNPSSVIRNEGRIERHPDILTDPSG